MESQFDREQQRGIVAIYKDRGETLAVLLERFRAHYDLLPATKLTYAGRLDPLAQGLVLILVGEDRFKKDALLGLPKEYAVDILLGIATDTADPLGMILRTDLQTIAQTDIEGVVAELTTITALPYPMYSSVLVDGMPLFVHARAGTAVVVPNKKVTIYSADLVGVRTEPISTLAQMVVGDVQRVKGDFRQGEIVEDWQQYSADAREVTIVSIRVSASSGTYMRSLAEWVGDRLGVPALAYRIVRTKLGDYVI